MNLIATLMLGSIFLPAFANSNSISALMSCEAEIRGLDEKNDYQIVRQSLSLTYQDLEVQNFETTVAEQSFSVSYRLKTQDITLRVIETLNPQNGLTSLSALDAAGMARLAVIKGPRTILLTCQRH